MNEDNLKNFLMVLRDSYRPVPYHNYFHAFNVAQTLYYFLMKCEIKEKFNDLEILALMVSAFCHDIDHPGLNNVFQINASTSLAHLYNDHSVLEQHHTHEAFSILRRDDCDLLVGAPEEKRKKLRTFVTYCILATDLADHGKFVKEFKEKNSTLDWSKEEDRKLMMALLVKAADISNEIRPAKIGANWAIAVMTEFYIQSAVEKNKKMPRAPHMDPEKTNTADGQIGFIQFLCYPFFELLASVFPKLDFACKQMESNSLNWKKIKEEKAKQKI